MPKLNNVRRKLTKAGYVRHERLSKEPIQRERINPSSPNLHAYGIPGCDYWVDCIGNGRDIRYSWGADGSDWVPRLAVLSKKKTFTCPNKRLKAWLDENYFSKAPHGYPKRQPSKIKMLDEHGEECMSIAKAIDASRLGR